MHRDASRLPKYRHYKPKDLAVVRLDGHDVYLGKYDSPESRERYRRVVGEWLATSSRPTPKTIPSADTVRTISEIVVAFWDHATSHYRLGDGTLSEELGNLKVALRPLRALYGTTPARDFGPLALRAVRDEMIRSGLARTSVNARINRVRRVFRWAASVELVPVSVVASIVTVAGLQKGRTEARESESILPVPIHVVEATVPYLSRPVAGLVRLQLLTGMRPGEACMMRDRDLARGDGLWIYRPASHKSAWRGKTREIPLGPKAIELLKGFVKDDPGEFLFSPAEAVAEHHANRSALRKSKPTPSEKAKRASKPGSGRATRYKRNTYLGAVNRACDRAFPHPKLGSVKSGQLTAVERLELAEWRSSHRWHPNQLRHAAATAVRAMFGLEAAQVVLGHSNADVTQVYAERDLAKAAEVMRQIG